MSAVSLFEEKQVRRAWNANEEKWVFAMADVIAILTDSPNPQVYWRVMKKRLNDEGNETVTNCNGLKMTAADGKQRMTDVADTEQLLRLIQSIPSPKAEPFKRWLAKVGYERLEEIENPELAAKRTRQIYQQKGYSEEWIEKRLRGIAVRDELTDEWQKRNCQPHYPFSTIQQFSRFPFYGETITITIVHESDRQQTAQVRPSTPYLLGARGDIRRHSKRQLGRLSRPAYPMANKRPSGLAKGEFVVPADFNDPLPDIEADFYGS